jgi:steroid 5-alpha reductase family enzyme
MTIAMTIPWGFLGLAFVLSLSVSALGFKRVYYFVSLCYAGAIAAQGVLIWLTHLDTLSGATWLLTLLLIAYGARLGLFLWRRERNPAYAKELALVEQRTANVSDKQKAAIWLGVGVLYSLLAWPVWLAASAQEQGLSTISVPIGVLVMIAGLGIESVADWQKSSFKAAQPSQYCDIGLYQIVRFPNYFGEILFWFGVWLAGISAYSTVLVWILATTALVYMLLLMIGAARNLEAKQDERYGAQPRYQDFVKTVPVLFPKLPVYTLRGIKIPIR